MKQLVVIKEDQIKILPSLREGILEWLHQGLEHPGSEHMYLALKDCIYQKGLHQNIIDYIEVCLMCQKYKINMKAYGIVPSSKLLIEP